MFGSGIQTHYPERYIELGDRVFIRISRGRQTLMEFAVENVGSFTDLIGEIRYAAQHIEGLTDVYIRNYSRGWSMMRPMKFYAAGRPQLRNAAVVTRQRRMLSPWETH